MKASLWNLAVCIFAYINFGISIVEIKNNIQTSFKTIVSKKTSTWRLRRASG